MLSLQMGALKLVCIVPFHCWLLSVTLDEKQKLFFTNCSRTGNLKSLRAERLLEGIEDKENFLFSTGTLTYAMFPQHCGGGNITMARAVLIEGS